MIRGPYHLISIGVLLIISYLLSILAVRLQLVPTRDHKKFWNTLLLLFFLSTALIGLLLAIEVNYKLDFSWVDDAMQWHVDLGIGFAIVSFFHLSWHLGYFRKIGNRIPSPLTETNTHLEFSMRQTSLLFILLGLLSIIAQLVLLREFTKTFHGNELTTGIFLAIWMLLTSTGAWAGSAYSKKVSLKTVLRFFTFLGIYPLFFYFLLILITRIILLPGLDPGMLVSASYMILLIAPFTLVSGFLFSYLSRSVELRTEKSLYYLLDSLGSLTGGILFGLILIFFFDNIQVLALLFLICSISMTVTGLCHPLISHKLLLLGSAFIISMMSMIPGIRNDVEGLRYRGETILETRDTPYGNLTFTIRNEQVTGYMDRNPVITALDLVSAEETVHFPALQHPDPANFLLIGGGLSGKAAEVSKYNPHNFDYSEADPRIFRLGKKHIPASSVKDLNFINRDGRRWLQSADSPVYDVIISAVGDPHTIGWNRYYTQEFYRMVHSHLSPGGIFGMQLSTGGNYINNEGSDMLNINFQTLKEVFNNVAIVPGAATYFIASDSTISLDIPGLLSRHGQINTTYVHPDYLDAFRLQFESDQIMKRISGGSPGINSDLRPLLFFKNISSWNSRFRDNMMDYSIFLGLIVFLVMFFSYTPLKKGMYITGFSGAGVQVMLIIVIQSFYGFAYLVTPIMVTIFMAGIVLGTRTWRSVWGRPTLTKYAGLIWTMALLAALVVMFLKAEQLHGNSFAGKFALGVLNMIPGIITGSVYGMSLSLKKSGSLPDIGRVYSADLAGAALGSFIPVVFILPLIGITNTFILFFGINTVTGIYILSHSPEK